MRAAGNIVKRVAPLAGDDEVEGRMDSLVFGPSRSALRPSARSIAWAMRIPGKGVEWVEIASVG